MTNYTIILPAFIDAKVQLPSQLAKQRAVSVQMLNQFAAVRNIPYGEMMSELAHQIYLQTGKTPAELLSQGITHVAGIGSPPSDGSAGDIDTSGSGSGSGSGGSGSSNGVPGWLNGIGDILNKIGNIFGLSGSGSSSSGSGSSSSGSGSSSSNSSTSTTDTTMTMIMSLLPVATIGLFIYLITKN
ncbi:MAG: hypothetical protein LBB41_06600 [Prevotellaceae bacterium]|jgi:hypothetical protein|nr:hypothetical protein [Prevotellaceae bacterium]